MAIVGGLLFGMIVSAGLWFLLRPTFHATVFMRENYRGAMVPVGAGVVVVLTQVCAAAVERGSFGAGLDQNLVRAGDLIFLAGLGFGLLGLLDDLAGEGSEKGFRGHLRALAEGRLTTGGLKLLGGGLLAIALSGSFDVNHPWRIVADALLVALSANLANLFDRAPGRSAKVSIVAGAVLLVTHLASPPHGLAVVVGALGGLLIFDLREELMLGDAGANVEGAAIGTALMICCSFPVRLIVLAVVLGLNVASEVVSFGSVIDRLPPLRYLDRIGRDGPAL